MTGRAAGRFRALAGAALVSAALLVLTGTPAFADDIRTQQWYLSALNVATAQAGGGGEGVTVAVIDSGVDGTHPDLTGTVVTGTNALTDSGDGWRDDVAHGTGIAAIIAGHGHGPGNADGVLGIAPKAKILPIGLQGNDPRLNFAPDTVAHAIDVAVERGAKVISAAFGTQLDDSVRNAVKRALDADVVIVAGIPNANPHGLDAIDAPAYYPGVVAVCAVDRKGNHASFSIAGDERTQPTICAPGVDGVNAKPGGGYDTGRFGTSMSTAIVVGAAALIRSKYPTMPAYEVMHQLIATAVDKGDPGRDKLYGYGNLDLVAAVTANIAPTASPTPWTKRSATPSASAPASAAPGAAAPGGKRRPGWLIGAAVAGLIAVAGLVFIVGWRWYRQASRPAKPGGIR